MGKHDEDWFDRNEGKILRWLLVLVLLSVVAAIAATKIAKIRWVSVYEFKEQWPLIVSQGFIRCEKSSKGVMWVFRTTSGHDFGMNKPALALYQSIKDIQGASYVDNNACLEGPHCDDPLISMKPLNEVASEMCND